MEGLPAHGSRPRYRKYNCRCVNCTTQTPMTGPIMWPLRHLEKAIGLERLRDWFDEETISRWRSEGLGDFEADEIAIKFGTMAHTVWQGWTMAGLDA